MGNDNQLVTVDRMMTYVETKRVSIEKVLPKHMTPERFLTQVRFALAKSKRLMSCTPASILESVMQAADLGLDPSGRLGSAYLVPFKDKCQLIPGYRGLIDLAHRSGEVGTIEAYIINQKDDFNWVKGKVPVHHPFVPEYTTEGETIDDDPGIMVGVWAVATMKGSKLRQADVLWRKEVLAIKARSPSVRADAESPWDTDESEMWKKTAVRRLVKYLPLSPEKARELGRALEIDPDGEDRLISPGPTEEPRSGTQASRLASVIIEHDSSRAGATPDDEPGTEE